MSEDKMEGGAEKTDRRHKERETMTEEITREKRSKKINKSQRRKENRRREK